ncbi:MAG: histidine phosphatase family protein [Patescibacteria group bacterium]
MKVLFSRHATPCERTSFFENVDLSEQGRDEARRLGLAYVEGEVDRIWASPLRRTAQTAEIAASVCGAEVEIEEQLIEIRHVRGDKPFERGQAVAEQVVLQGGQHLAVVTHCGFLRYALTAAMHRDVSSRLDLPTAPCASVSELDLTSTGGELVRLNDIAHLG